MDIFSEEQKLRIKERFYQNWRICSKEIQNQKKEFFLNHPNEPLLFVLHRVIIDTGISDEIDYRPHKQLPDLVNKLKLTCATCGSELNAHSKVGKYVKSNKSKSSLSSDDEIEEEFSKIIIKPDDEIEDFKKETVSINSLPTIQNSDSSHQTVNYKKVVKKSYRGVVYYESKNSDDLPSSQSDSSARNSTESQSGKKYRGLPYS